MTLAIGVALLALERRVGARGVPGDSLSKDEERFRTDLMRRVDRLESEVQQLRDDNQVMREKELEGRERFMSVFYFAPQVLSTYNSVVALLQRIAPQEPIPIPPDPPPAYRDALTGGGLTGASPRPRTMPAQTQRSLMELLLTTALAANTPTVRDELLRNLPSGYVAGLHRSAAAREDLQTMLADALAFGGDPPCLSLWLDNVAEALGVGSQAHTALLAWRKQNHW